MNSRIILCDYAKVTDDGTRFDAIGAGLNLVHAPQFPYSVSFVILVETRFSRSEAGRKHPFELKILDPEKNHLSPPIIGDINPSDNHRGFLYAAFRIQMQIKKAASLTFCLLINGEEKDIVSVEIAQTL